MEREHDMIVEKIRRSVNKSFYYGMCGCCGFTGSCVANIKKSFNYGKCACCGFTGGCGRR